jgi:hypothetical protein
LLARGPATPATFCSKPIVLSCRPTSFFRERLDLPPKLSCSEHSQAINVAGWDDDGSIPPAVGWSAHFIRKGLDLLPDLDDAATGHLRRLEGLLPAVCRVLDASDAGAIDIDGRPLQELLDAAYAADDGLGDVECARGDGKARWSPIGTIVARKPCSPLRFLLCFSPPRTSVASRAHGKSSKAKNDDVNLDGLRDALETLAQAAYRCTSTYEHVEPCKNYATFVAGRTQDRTGEAEHDDIFGKEAEVEQIMENVRSSDDPHYRLIPESARRHSCGTSSTTRSSRPSSPCGCGCTSLACSVSGRSSFIR